MRFQIRIDEMQIAIQSSVIRNPPAEENKHVVGFDIGGFALPRPEPTGSLSPLSSGYRHVITGL
jgi:hypothetical protein